MTIDVNRRRLLGQGGMIAPLLGLGLLTGTAAAEAAGAPEGAAVRTTLAGTWSVRVAFADPSIAGEMGLFAFTGEGICFCTTTRARHLSLGGWRTTDQGFEYSFRHFTYNDAGDSIGEVHV